MHVFETRTTTGRGHFACQDSGVFQIFIPSISNGEKRLGNANAVCEDKLKGKTAHFRLPSVSQKRACLSPLLSDDSARPRKIPRWIVLVPENTCVNKRANGK